jgi:CRP/FNR family transcriptional regulator
MSARFALEISESCAECEVRFGRLFCNLPNEALRAFDQIKQTICYPKGAMLYLEGQSPRGAFVLCGGRVKLSASSAEGKAMIIHIAAPGSVLGLSATLSGQPYEATAETLEPVTLNFVRRDSFLAFLKAHGEACLRVAEHLSCDYNVAYERARSLALSTSAAEKLARWILEWADSEGRPAENGIQLKLTLTHEEISQLIATSRETVTRLLSDLKNQRIIEVKGVNFLIRDKRALEAMVRSQPPTRICAPCHTHR